MAENEIDFERKKNAEWKRVTEKGRNNNWKSRKERKNKLKRIIKKKQYFLEEWKSFTKRNRFKKEETIIEKEMTIQRKKVWLKRNLFRKNESIKTYWKR